MTGTMTHTDVGNPARIAPERASLSPTLAFELLANKRRRALVTFLLDAHHEVAVEELVDVLADGDAAETAIAISLHYAHLPKLAAVGVIERDEEFVEATPLLSDLEPFLRPAADLESGI